ncbi:MAG TPA: hypothetical protein VKJ45_15115 [Blastocatellia bacterium]|nr:hypothetical protein [Blastocatellia bacterium]
MTIGHESARRSAYRLFQPVLYIKSKAQTDFALEDAIGGTGVHFRVKADTLLEQLQCRLDGDDSPASYRMSRSKLN